MAEPDDHADLEARVGALESQVRAIAALLSLLHDHVATLDTRTYAGHGTLPVFGNFPVICDHPIDLPRPVTP